jgi:hypothetical protein
MATNTYTVDVAIASLDDLKAGRTATASSRVRVAADNDIDAVLIACQMVAARSGLMPTSALLRDFPT